MAELETLESLSVVHINSPILVLVEHQNDQKTDPLEKLSMICGEARVIGRL